MAQWFYVESKDCSVLITLFVFMIGQEISKEISKESWLVDVVPPKILTP